MLYLKYTPKSAACSSGQTKKMPPQSAFQKAFQGSILMLADA